MSKHTSTQFHYHQHQDHPRHHKQLYTQLKHSPSIWHIIKELAMGIVMLAILTASLWLPATGWITN